MEKQNHSALSDIKVADFGWAAAGAIIGSTLGAFGATVVKIESRSAIDITRVVQPYKDGIPGIDRSGSYLAYNNSKLSLSVNMTSPKGIELIKKLIAWADVLIENFTPGQIKKWGLSYEHMTQINPDIIMLSSSMQGQNGPFARHPGLGTNLQCLAGFTELTGWPDRDACVPHEAYPDCIAPWYGITAILAALEYRRRTGKGQYIDQSQLESALQFLGPPIMDYATNKRIETRRGNRSTRFAPHGVYRCKGNDCLGNDRWCTISVQTPEEWLAFCKVLGNPDWTQDAKFTTFFNRMNNAEELDKLIEAWAINHQAEEVMDLMQAAGVPAGVIQNSQDTMDNDSQLKYRHCYQLQEHPVMGTVSNRDVPAKLSETPSNLFHSGCLGEHNAYVCTEILGLSDEEFVELCNEKVLE